MIVRRNDVVQMNGAPAGRHCDERNDRSGIGTEDNMGVDDLSPSRHHLPKCAGCGKKLLLRRPATGIIEDPMKFDAGGSLKAGL